MHNRIRALTLSLAVASIGGCYGTPVEPELPAKVSGIPPYWQGTVGPSAAYEIGLDRIRRRSGRFALYLAGPRYATPDAAILRQYVRADNYRGKRMRLSAWVRGEELIGYLAGLWMRVDGPGVILGLDNMSTRADSGTTDWHKVSIVLDVPTNALGIVIGALMRGGGTMYIDDMTLEPVGNDVPSTNTRDAPVAWEDSATTVARYLDAFTSPANTDFERVRPGEQPGCGEERTRRLGVPTQHLIGDVCGSQRVDGARKALSLPGPSHRDGQ